MIMKRCRQALLLLWLTAVVAVNIFGSNAAEEDTLQVQSLTNKSLQVIPLSRNSSTVTELVIEGSLVTLNETDRLALASYPKLEELHLDGNQVTGIPANYFSVVPQLKVLSLSRNEISSLDPEAFSGLHVLTELDLSHNLLTSLHPQLFSQLHNLQALNLQDNPWNCSCPLLSSIVKIKAAGATTGPRVTCASPENQAGKDLLQATAECYPPPKSNATTDPQQPSTPVNFRQSWDSFTTQKTVLTSQNQIKKELAQKPVLSNSWKFTVCVAVLALFTSTLIVCAIKGPSWYKLFHNYRHRRLRQEEDEEGDVVPTVFSQTGTYMNHQTFTFERENRRIEAEEEEEDGYIEDPYIKREE